jgi:general stress protein CsbA
MAKRIVAVKYVVPRAMAWAFTPELLAKTVVRITKPRWVALVLKIAAAAKYAAVKW